MNIAMKVAVVVLVGLPLVGAAEEQSQLSCIRDITYSQEFLARYPQAGAACREVIMVNGQKWVRFDAKVAKVTGNQVTTNFIDSHDQSVATLTFAADPDARVDVKGKLTLYTALKEGNKLTFWMPESRMGFYAKPGASEPSKLTLVSDANK